MKNKMIIKSSLLICFLFSANLSLATHTTTSNTHESLSEKEVEIIVIDEKGNCFDISSGDQITTGCEENFLTNLADKSVNQTQQIISSNGTCLVQNDNTILPCNEKQEQDLYNSFLEKFSEKADFDIDIDIVDFDHMIKNMITAPSFLIIGSLLSAQIVLMIIHPAIISAIATGVVVYLFIKVIQRSYKNYFRNIVSTLCEIYRDAIVELELNTSLHCPGTEL